MSVVDLLSWTLLVAGALACIVGCLGLLRLPEFYSRTHAASITDTLGATLILVGLMIQSGLDLVTVKLFAILLFVYVTSPTASHALARAAFAFGQKAEVDGEEIDAVPD